MTNLFDKNDERAIWMRWNRTLMGFRSSPFIACKIYGWCLDVVQGDITNEKNSFRWDGIKLNLPGSQHFDPTIPWAMKQWKNKEANDAKVYVDDVRPFGGSAQGCRLTGKTTSKKSVI